MWCLGRFLPLMIGNLIPQDGERWQLFNMLLEINDIVFSPIVSEDSIVVLEGLSWKISDSKDALYGSLPITDVKVSTN